MRSTCALDQFLQATHGGDGEGELRHWVEGVGASVNQFLDKLGNLGSGSPFLRKTLDLVGSWDFSSEEQPEEGFWQWLGSTWGGR